MSDQIAPPTGHAGIFIHGCRPSGKCKRRAVIVTGHSDVLEAGKNGRGLSEACAKVMAEYLVQKGREPRVRSV